MCLGHDDQVNLTSEFELRRQSDDLVYLCTRRKRSDTEVEKSR